MRVAQALILIPVFFQAALTLCILALLWVERVRWMKSQRIRPNDVALAGASVWSERAQKLSNNYSNLLELPVLFYVCSLAALSLRMVDLWMLVLAGAFVVSRLVHSAIHIGPNWVLQRFYAALSSMIFVSMMWVLLMWRVAAAGF